MANFALRQVLNETLLVEEKVEDVSKNSGGTKTQTHRLLPDLTAAHCLKITQNVAFEFFEFWHFTPIFVSKLTCLVTLFDRKLQVFKNSPKLTFVHSKCKCSSLRSQ